MSAVRLRHNAEAIEHAEFNNVRITVPAKTDFVPYRDYIGSNLEILDIATGRRKIIHHQDDSIQAPNWTPDGKSLIYNGSGRLFRFDLETRKPTPIDTGNANANNNDHVLSFDGDKSESAIIAPSMRENRSSIRCRSRAARHGK